MSGRGSDPRTAHSRSKVRAFEDGLYGVGEGEGAKGGQDRAPGRRRSWECSSD